MRQGYCLFFLCCVFVFAGQRLIAQHVEEEGSGAGFLGANEIPFAEGVEFSNTSGSDDGFAVGNDESVYVNYQIQNINELDSFQIALKGIAIHAAGSLVKYRNQWGALISWNELVDLAYWDSTMVEQAKSLFYISKSKDIDWNRFKGRVENWNNYQSSSGAFRNQQRIRLNWDAETDASLMVSERMNSKQENTYLVSGYARGRLSKNINMLVGSYRLDAGCGILQSGTIFTNRAMNPFQGFLSRRASITPYNGFTPSFARQGVALDYGKNNSSILGYVDALNKQIGAIYEYHLGDKLVGIQFQKGLIGAYSGSVYGRQRIDHVLMNGEVAFTNKGIGATGYLIIPLGYSATVSSGLRYFDSTYSTIGLPYMQSSKANNEVGWVSTFSKILPRKINLSATLDVFGRASGPQNKGYELAFFLNKASYWNVAFKYRKPLSLSSLAIAEGLNLRLTYFVVRQSNLDGQILFSGYLGSGKASEAFSWQSRYKMRGWAVGGRITTFYASTYSSRVYIQEREISGFYRYRALYGVGSTGYMFMQANFMKNWAFEGKVGYVDSNQGNSFEAGLYIRYNFTS